MYSTLSVPFEIYVIYPNLSPQRKLYMIFHLFHAVRDTQAIPPSLFSASRPACCSSTRPISPVNNISVSDIWLPCFCRPKGEVEDGSRTGRNRPSGSGLVRSKCGLVSKHVWLPLSCLGDMESEADAPSLDKGTSRAAKSCLSLVRGRDYFEQTSFLIKKKWRRVA